MSTNIVIGTPLVHLDALGVTEDEQTITLSFEDLLNDEDQVFLPTVLKQAGIFKSTSDIRQVNKQRQNSSKITDHLEKNLWRNVEEPEFTQFKVGKQIFCLIVGQRDK